MAQYKTGTVSTVNNSTAISGDATLFLANVSIGDFFVAEGDSVIYTVATISSDTSIVLSAPYQGSTQSGAAYSITRDFSNTYSFSYLSAGDISSSVVYNQFINDVESTLVLKSDSSHNHDVNYLKLSGGTLTGNLTLSSTANEILMIDTNAAVDEKRWAIRNSAGNFSVRSFTDAGAAVADVIKLERVGTATTNMDLSATNINLNGAVVGSTTPTAAAHLTRKDYVDGSSDRRTKSNIKNYKNALEQINTLKIVEFIYDDCAPAHAGHKSVGVIAQDLEENGFEDFVHHHANGCESDDRLKYVDYQALFSISIKAIQELEKRLEKIEKDLVEETVEEFAKRINNMETSGKIMTDDEMNKELGI